MAGPVDLPRSELEISADTVDDTAVSVPYMTAAPCVFGTRRPGTTRSTATRAYAYVREHQARSEIATRLLYLDERSRDMHAVANTVERPLVEG